MANEKRLIDCAEFVKECDRLYKNPPFAHPATPWDRGLQLAVEAALLLPRVDAVEVCRCKDCKFYQTDHWCTRVALGIMYENDFYSYGERRTEK